MGSAREKEKVWIEEAIPKLWMKKFFFYLPFLSMYFF